MDKLKKMGFQIALLFSVLVLAIGAISYLSSDSDHQALVDLPLSITYVMVVVGVILSVVLPLMKALQDPKTLKYTAISVGILALLLIVTYGSSNGVVPQDTTGTYDGITSSNLKLAGSLLTTAVILVVVGIAGLIALEVKSIIKK